MHIFVKTSEFSGKGRPALGDYKAKVLSQHIFVMGGGGWSKRVKKFWLHTFLQNDNNFIYFTSLFILYIVDEKCTFFKFIYLRVKLIVYKYK